MNSRYAKSLKKVGANENKSLSAMLLDNGARKVFDNPQVRGIDVTPLNVEILGIEVQEKKGRARKRSQS
jgi:hypothetical protein